jgi:predicted alpha/beta hydrolase family esterase
MFISKNMKRVFIIHGWKASPESNWFPWLKNELEKNGIAVEVLAMPYSVHPKCEEWVNYLKEKVGQVDEDVILIGHSLGTITILNYLSVLKEGEKIGGTILVSGSAENPGFEELNSFFETMFDHERMRKASKKFVAIHSDDDPVVPFEMGKRMSDILQAEFITIHNGEHLNAGNGLFEMPIVLEKILEINK